MQRTVTDVENNEVRNWSVQQVILWLKHTSSGMFEDFVPAFNENHITVRIHSALRTISFFILQPLTLCMIYVLSMNQGEALLSLNNEVLRDEFGIKSYGKRFELLKAIQKLAKRTSSSPGKMKSSGRQISQTYYKGMPTKQPVSTSYLSNDNWYNHNNVQSPILNMYPLCTIPFLIPYEINRENLDVIASNTNMLDAKEYSKMINDVVLQVTGTEISKKTREKHSFYRKLSNLSLASQRKDLPMDDGTQILNQSGGCLEERGGYEYDINMPS